MENIRLPKKEMAMTLEQEIANMLSFLNSLSKDYQDLDFIFTFNYKDSDNQERGGTLLTTMEADLFQDLQDKQLEVWSELTHGTDVNEMVERVKKILNEKNSNKDGEEKTDG
jgi:hypothetical protein